jgi:hypothetical protein
MFTILDRLIDQTIAAFSFFARCCAGWIGCVLMRREWEVAPRASSERSPTRTRGAASSKSPSKICGKRNFDVAEFLRIVPPFTLIAADYPHPLAVIFGIRSVAKESAFSLSLARSPPSPYLSLTLTAAFLPVCPVKLVANVGAVEQQAGI